MTKHSVSVAGVVVDDQHRVLMIQRRDNGRWEPPGGVLEIDETFEEGVRREIMEETGIAVTVTQLSGAYKNMERGIVALVFRCEPTGGTVQTSDESTAVKWMELAEALAKMDEAYAVRVSDAYQNVPAVRAHDGVRVLAR